MSKRIIVSVFITLVMVGGALWFSRTPQTSQNSEITEIVSPEEKQDESLMGQSTEEGTDRGENKGTDKGDDKGLGGGETIYLTEDLAQNLVEQYAGAYQSGDELTQEELLKAVDAYLEEYKIEDQFSYTDITSEVVADSIEVKKKYWNEAASILIFYLSDLEEDELSIFTSAMENNDTERLAELSAHRAAYQNIVLKLQQIDIPVACAYFHLIALNSFNNINTAIALMQNGLADPAQGLLGIKLAIEEVKKWQESIEKAEAELLQDKIEFGENEPAQFIFGNI